MITLILIQYFNTEVASNKSRVPVSKKSSDARARKRVVRVIGSWFQAWSAFAANLLNTDPSRGHELLGYQAIIAQANADYQPSAWLQYDSSFRLLASRHQSLRWDAIHNHLWAQCFTGRAVSTVTCFSCGRPGHIASDCKSSNNSFRAPNKPYTPNSSQAASSQSMFDVCRQFNSGKCRNQATPHLCKYRHECLFCQGDHPEVSCARKGVNKSA